MVLSASGHFHILFPRGPLTATDSGSQEGNRACGMGTDLMLRANRPTCRGALPRCRFLRPGRRVGTPQPSPPVRDLSTLGPLQRSPSGVPRRLCHVPAHGRATQVPVPCSTGAVRSPYRLCSSSCLKKTPSGTGSPPWGEEEGTAVSREGTLAAGWVAMPSRRRTQLANGPQGHSLGHLGDVFVAQGDPQVVVLVQENLLDPGLPDATCLIPGKRAGSITAGMGLGGHAVPSLPGTMCGSREVWGDGGTWGLFLALISSRFRILPSCTPSAAKRWEGAKG